MEKQITVEANLDENNSWNELSKKFIHKYLFKYIKRVAAYSKFVLSHKDEAISINKIYDADENFTFEVDDYPSNPVDEYDFVIYTEFPSMAKKEPKLDMKLNKFFKKIKENTNGKKKEKSN